MFSTKRLVRFARFWSRCSLPLVIVRDKFTGMEVNRDFTCTSKETMNSSLEMECYLIWWVNIELFCRTVQVFFSQIEYGNELRFHISDEGLSISRNVCWETTRVSGKPFSIELLATSINIDQRIHEKSNRSLAGSEGARENNPFIPTSNFSGKCFIFRSWDFCKCLCTMC